MKLPRDCKALNIISMLKKHGYVITKQVGSHIRLTTERNGIHHITIPDHNPIKIGTLNSILNDVSIHLNIPKDDLLKLL